MEDRDTRYSKKCEFCGSIFYKPTTRSLKTWHTITKYCSAPCLNLGRVTPEFRENISKSQHEFYLTHGYGRTKGHTKSVPVWNKDKPYLRIRGEGHWNWKGGINPESDNRLHHIEWKQIRKQVLQRDEYTCTDCGKSLKTDSSLKLAVHHIIPWRSTRNDAEDNLATLCNSCHTKRDIHLLLAGQVAYRKRLV